MTTPLQDLYADFGERINQEKAHVVGLEGFPATPIMKYEIFPG